MSNSRSKPTNGRNFTTSLDVSMFQGLLGRRKSDGFRTKGAGFGELWSEHWLFDNPRGLVCPWDIGARLETG